MNIEKVITELKLCPERLDPQEISTLSRLLRWAAKAPPERPLIKVADGEGLGNWVFSFKPPYDSIDYHGVGGDPYEVPLETSYAYQRFHCGCEKGFAKWLAHLQEKSWASECDDLIRCVLAYQAKKAGSK